MARMNKNSRIESRNVGSSVVTETTRREPGTPVFRAVSQRNGHTSTLELDVGH